jgi:shikimate kinase
VHGIGRSHGAITIVNALPTGIGAAAGVDLPVVAEVELHPAGSHGRWEVRVPDATRSPLVVATLTEALRHYAPGSSGSGELSLRSEVPVAQGLKSSSAVSSAIALAVARATDSATTPEDVARISATASLAVGVSATGAFDDALAGLRDGIVVTDNDRKELVASLPLNPEWTVALYVADGTHRPAPEYLAAFRAEGPVGRRAADAARRGEWANAMRENSALVERVVGYDYAEIRAELELRGAIAAGVSGLGPTLAAVVPAARAREVEAGLPGPAHRRRLVRFLRGTEAGP